MYLRVSAPSHSYIQSRSFLIFFIFISIRSHERMILDPCTQIPESLGKGTGYTYLSFRSRLPCAALYSPFLDLG